MISIKKKNWNDITISDYRKIKDITERELDSDLEKGIAILAVLCGCSEDDIYDLNINTLTRLLGDIEWIKTPFEFNKNWKAKHIIINGEKYDVDVDINHFTVAQYTDFQIYWDKKDDIDYMGRLLTLFITPNGKKYNDGYDMGEMINILENNINVVEWNSIVFFFLKDLMLSLKASLFYSNWEVMKMRIREKNPKKRQEMGQILTKLQMLIRTIG